MDSRGTIHPRLHSQRLHPAHSRSFDSIDGASARSGEVQASLERYIRWSGMLFLFPTNQQKPKERQTTNYKLPTITLFTLPIFTHTHLQQCLKLPTPTSTPTPVPQPPRSSSRTLSDSCPRVSSVSRAVIPTCSPLCLGAPLRTIGASHPAAHHPPRRYFILSSDIPSLQACRIRIALTSRIL